MTLPSFATVGQLEARLPGGALDEAREQAALDDASALVRAEARKNWTKVEGEATVLDLPSGDDEWRADLVVRVTLSAAMRSLLNPEGVTSEQVGTYQVGFANASTDVYLTAAERRQVRKAAGMANLWTQPTTRGDCPDLPPVSDRCGPSEFVDVEYAPSMAAGEPIPWA